MGRGKRRLIAAALNFKPQECRILGTAEICLSSRIFCLPLKMAVVASDPGTQPGTWHGY